MNLTKEEGRNVIYGDHEDFELVKGTKEIVDQSRWSTMSRAVFLHKPSGKHFELSWSEGSTESQGFRRHGVRGESPFEYDDPKPIEVESQEVMVTKWVEVGI